MGSISSNVAAGGGGGGAKRTKLVSTFDQFSRPATLSGTVNNGTLVQTGGGLQAFGPWYEIIAAADNVVATNDCYILDHTLIPRNTNIGPNQCQIGFGAVGAESVVADYAVYYYFSATPVTREVVHVFDPYIYVPAGTRVSLRRRELFSNNTNIETSNYLTLAKAASLESF